MTNEQSEERTCAKPGCTNVVAFPDADYCGSRTCGVTPAPSDKPRIRTWISEIPEEPIMRFIPADAPALNGEQAKCPQHFYEIDGPCICPSEEPKPRVLIIDGEEGLRAKLERLTAEPKPCASIVCETCKALCGYDRGHAGEHNGLHAINCPLVPTAAEPKDAVTPRYVIERDREEWTVRDTATDKVMVRDIYEQTAITWAEKLNREAVKDEPNVFQELQQAGQRYFDALACRPALLRGDDLEAAMTFLARRRTFDDEEHSAILALIGELKHWRPTSPVKEGEPNWKAQALKCVEELRAKDELIAHLQELTNDVPVKEEGFDADYVDVVFDGPPSNVTGRFVECESPAGVGVKVGEWIDRGDGYWVLRIPRRSTAPLDVRRIVTRLCNFAEEFKPFNVPVQKDAEWIYDELHAIADELSALMEGK